MSAICGIVRLDGAPVERREIEKMVSRAANRGPDGVSYHIDGSFGVACLTMLTTPDRTGVCRPVTSVGGAVVVAADARVDNRDELMRFAAGLEAVDDVARDPARPHRPSDREVPTDVEVMFPVLAARRRDPGRVIGDFAYAQWWRDRREIRLARDPMGLRSLYYRVEPGRILFATEARQILAADRVPRKLNERTVAFYLTGMQTPAGSGFYDGIHAVRPGWEVVIDASGTTRTEPFWQPDLAARIRYRDERDYPAHLRELFVESVRCRLRARGPVAISLSGGMDSASVASVAGRLHEIDGTTPEMNTYTWAFTAMPELDERENVHRITGRYRMRTHDIPAEETRPLDGYPDHGPHEDDPFISMYQPFIDRVMAAARDDDASVMFYGNRGDVITGGGVTDVRGLLRAGLLRTARTELGYLRSIDEITRLQVLTRDLVLPAVYDLLPRSAGTALRRALSARDGSIAKRAADHVRRDFLARVSLPVFDPIDSEADCIRPTAQRSRFRHIFSPLVEHGLLFLERHAALYGLGFADPWSDRRITEFALASPQYVLSRMTDSKRLARRAVAGIMPIDAVNAARKVSPEPHYLQALRGSAQPAVRSLITNSRCAHLGFIDDEALAARYERFVRGDESIFDIWSTLSLEIWLRRFWG